MIIIMMTMMSICAIAFTHLLSKRKLKIGAIAVATLFIALVIWVFFVFIGDVANFGFKDSKNAELFSSVIFRSFTELRDLMSVMPQSLHMATASFAFLISGMVILGLLLGSIEIYCAIVKHLRKYVYTSQSDYSKALCNIKNIPFSRRLYLLNCRLNN